MYYGSIFPGILAFLVGFSWYKVIKSPYKLLAFSIFTTILIIGLLILVSLILPNAYIYEFSDGKIRDINDYSIIIPALLRGSQFLIVSIITSFALSGYMIFQRKKLN